MKNNSNSDYEFSRPVRMGDVSETQPMNKSIEAKPNELKALAKRFEILEVKNLVADLTLTRQMAGRMVSVKGKLSADVMQECIVTLEPLEDHLEGTFEAFFTDIKPPTPIASEVELKDEDEAPEFVKDGIIDVGEVSAQFMALEIDPYPRKEGAESDYVTAEAEDDTPVQDTHRPFEVLKNLTKD